MYEYASSSSAVVSAVLEIVGASLVLVTVRTYVVVTASVPSDATNTIVLAPTSSLVGVPVIVPELIESELGPVDIAYVSVSPASTSANTDEISKLYTASSAVVASEIAFATVGASLVFTTVRTYESLTDALEPSVQVTTIVCVPTSALTGVPLIVVPLRVIVLGAPDIEYVQESPVSTSAKTLLIDNE